ncbi:MAG TPA: hypothetical protein VG758_14135 [Hyphomicrobiaceae bacterium]|jgi:hypothetical protein|nr:hypothetical protein [Hyphomicrobiaceae bacterium]
MSNTSMTLGEFVRLLDVYGGERARWPADARAAAAHLVAKDAQAQQLLAEAEALDRVLRKAPLPALAAEAALAERIVAAAQRSPRMVKLLDSPPAASGSEAAVAPVAAIRSGPPRRMRLLSREAGAAGFLVASLVVGVVIGNSNLPRQIVPELADLAGLSSERSGLVQIALSDEVLQ